MPHKVYNNLVNIHCVATQGKGVCGKRQCSGKARKQLVTQLKSKTVENLRAQDAGRMMRVGDVNEPPFLYTAHVVRTAIYKHNLSKFKNVKAITDHPLKMLKRSPDGNGIVVLTEPDGNGIEVLHSKHILEHTFKIVYSNSTRSQSEINIIGHDLFVGTQKINCLLKLGVFRK